MTYFDAVVASQPDFYFPLQGNTSNYGKFDDEIVGESQISYIRFPMSSSSLKAVDLDSNTLSTNAFTSKIPTKIWKKTLVIECLLKPSSETTIFETNDSYYDDENNLNMLNQSVVSVKYKNGRIEVSVHENTFISKPLTTERVHHFVVVINSGTVLIYDWGHLIGSGSYEDFDLYNYNVNDIVVYGDGYLSDLALYLSEKNLSEIVDHYSYLYEGLDKLHTLSKANSSLSYSFDSNSMESTPVFVSPRIIGNETSLSYSDYNNVVVDQDTAEASANSNFSLSIIDESGYELPYLYSGAILNNFGKLIIPGRTLILEFNDYSINEFDKVIFKAVWPGGEIKIELIDNEVIGSYATQSFSETYTFSSTPDTNYRFELEVIDYKDFEIRMLSDDLELDSFTTESALPLSSAQICIFSDLDGSSAFYGAELVELTVKDSDSATVYVDVVPETLEIVNSGTIDVEFKKTDESDSKVFWSPIHPSISLPGVSYGDTVQDEQLTLSLQGNQDILSPSIYATYVFDYPSKEIIPVVGAEAIKIEGDFVPPIVNSNSPIAYSPYENFKLNQGRMKIAPNTAYQNYVYDWSCVNPSDWSFSGCQGQVFYDSTLTTGSGIIVEYSNSTPVVKSSKLLVRPNTDYDLSVLIKTLSGTSNLSLYVEWYNLQDELISQSSATPITFSGLLNSYASTVTSPALSYYAKVCVSSSQSSGSFIIDDVFFGKNFSGIYQSNSYQFKNFSILFRSDEDSLELFYHNFYIEYYIEINSGIISFSGFSSVKVNGVEVSSGSAINDLDGWNHVSASFSEDGKIQVSDSYPIYIGGASGPVGTFYVGALSLSMESLDWQYESFFADNFESSVTEPSALQTLLDNDSIVFVNSPWNII